MTEMPIAPDNTPFQALQSLRSRQHPSLKGVCKCSDRTPRTLVRSLGSRMTAIASSLLITLSIGVGAAMAKDPFRTTNPHSIGPNTEAAFRAIFEKGNYVEGQEYLKNAETDEPMAYAMQASLAYTTKDWEGFKVNGTRTRETAEALIKTNPLRGNLYAAVGHFLEGAYILSQQGTVRGTPEALNRLQQVFKHLKVAERISPQDPELNVVKGFMDLMLAVNLPFSNPGQAVERLEKYANPRYLAYRGIALGYRDLKQYDKSLDYVNRAIAVTPNQPEVQYLKAQILAAKAYEQKNAKLYAEAGKYFQLALAKPEQLPKSLVWQIFFEQCQAQERLDNKPRNCSPLRDTINQQPGPWGPKAKNMPVLSP
ncbi:MAG: Sll0314/Alr1548 family TPR repeat-containing protein [Leptolyngbyaceae bacterium]|nr:Sll0314/Alr1548 family TPR repeat-containing protein [Leptolyngbyaceae bacterium]